MTAPVEFEVKVAEAVVVRPGDTLVLRTGSSVTAEDIEHLMAAARDHLPGVKVLVIDDAFGQMVAHRPAGEQQ